MNQNLSNEEQPSVTPSDEAGNATLDAVQKYQNPLPCGCGIMGTPQLNGYGSEYELRQEYLNKFIKFCPLHAAALTLHAALAALDDMYQASGQRWDNARAALALANGQDTKTA